MRISAIFAASLATLSFASIAAANDTDNLAVTATVASSCSITGNTLAFGTYNTISGAAVDNATSIAVACTTGTDTTITLGEGENPSGASAPGAPARRMLDPVSGDLMSYSLYLEGTRTDIWGDTLGTGLPYHALSSASQNQTVYGRIAAGQDVVAGSYGDSVLATIAF